MASKWEKGNRFMNEMMTIRQYTDTEKLILVLSRYDRTDYEEIVNHINFDNIDWSFFLGYAMINRVNGVIYEKIEELDVVPYYVKFFLKTVYKEQKKRTEIHQNEIRIVTDLLEKNGIRYAMLKGAVLNTIFYTPGERISNDTDIMVHVDDIDRTVKLLKGEGYIQGDIKDGECVPATKKEILFARLNTYEIVPLFKKTGYDEYPFHEVDINFRLSNDDDQSRALELLENTVVINNNSFDIRTLSLENFLLFLCIHHYREATMILKIVDGTDLTLYKFMDIHFFVSQKRTEIDWNKLKEICINLKRFKDVYYTLYYTERLYPGTIDDSVFEMFKPDNTDFINQYKGRDNSTEVYTWEMKFEDRFFSYKRKLEAMRNIEAENKRFTEILEKLKN